MSDQVVMDASQDTNGVELVKYAQTYDMPEYVKTANLESIRNPHDLPATAYADPLNRLYPCHSSAATYLSYLYFQDKVANYSPAVASAVQKRLDNAANVWGIAGDIKAAHDKYEILTKTAAADHPDTDYAFVFQAENGEKYRQLLLTTPEQIKTAAAWLHQYRNDIPFGDRNLIATRILDKAANCNVDFGEELDLFVDRQAGRGFCQLKEVVAAVRQRALLTTNPDFRVEIEKMAEMLEGKPSTALTHDMLCKTAATLEQLDQSFGVTPDQYGQLLQRPEDVVFSVSFKQAHDAASSAVALTTGNTYDSSDFAKIGQAAVAHEMGADFANEVFDAIGQMNTTKLAELAATLPVPDAEAFERVLKQAGVPPVVSKTAADARRGPGGQELSDLAARY